MHRRSCFRVRALQPQDERRSNFSRQQIVLSCKLPAQSCWKFALLRWLANYRGRALRTYFHQAAHCRVARRRRKVYFPPTLPPRSQSRSHLETGLQCFAVIFQYENLSGSATAWQPAYRGASRRTASSRTKDGSQTLQIRVYDRCQAYTHPAHSRNCPG